MNWLLYGTLMSPSSSFMRASGTNTIRLLNMPPETSTVAHIGSPSPPGAYTRSTSPSLRPSWSWTVQPTSSAGSEIGLVTAPVPTPSADLRHRHRDGRARQDPATGTRAGAAHVLGAWDQERVEGVRVFDVHVQAQSLKRLCRSVRTVVGHVRDRDEDLAVDADRRHRGFVADPAGQHVNEVGAGL